MTALRSLVFNVLSFAWTILLLVICIPAFALPRRVVLRVGRLWSKGITCMLATICGLGHEIRGLEHLPDGPCIVAAKHQSAWDTVIFHQIFDGPSYVLKRELTWIPLFGWYLARAACVAIDRSGGAAALRKMVEQARHIVSQGRAIVIFPEGTRVKPGHHLPYHPGVAALYVQLGVPVVPVALNSGLFWGRRTFLKKPGRITLEILPPIAPGLERKAFTAELELRIETATRHLLSEAQA
jgi:1-acyl-sn-glycerol-3-phosphate acyltransferase